MTFSVPQGPLPRNLNNEDGALLPKMLGPVPGAGEGENLVLEFSGHVTGHFATWVLNAIPSPF